MATHPFYKLVDIVEEEGNRILIFPSSPEEYDDYLAKCKEDYESGNREKKFTGIGKERIKWLCICDEETSSVYESFKRNLNQGKENTCSGCSGNKRSEKIPFAELVKVLDIRNGEGNWEFTRDPPNEHNFKLKKKYYYLVNGKEKSITLKNVRDSKARSERKIADCYPEKEEKEKEEEEEEEKEKEKEKEKIDETLQENTMISRKNLPEQKVGKTLQENKIISNKPPTSNTTLSYEDVKKSFFDHGYELLATHYQSNKAPLECVCIGCGNKPPNGISLTNVKKSNCKICMPSRKAPWEKIVKKAEESNAKLITTKDKYINNTTSIDFICGCGNHHARSWKHADKAGFSCRDCGNDKREKTVQETYGQRNVMHVPQIMQDNLQNRGDGVRKDGSRSHTTLVFVFPSGNKVILQSLEEKFYMERFVAEKKDISEKDIVLVPTEMPEFWYKRDSSGKQRYFPDVYIRSTNTIIEIKAKSNRFTSKIKEKIECVTEKCNYTIQYCTENGFWFAHHYAKGKGEASHIKTNSQFVIIASDLPQIGSSVFEKEEPRLFDEDGIELPMKKKKIPSSEQLSAMKKAEKFYFQNIVPLIEKGVLIKTSKDVIIEKAREAILNGGRQDRIEIKFCCANSNKDIKCDCEPRIQYYQAVQNDFICRRCITIANDPNYLTFDRFQEEFCEKYPNHDLLTTAEEWHVKSRTVQPSNVRIRYTCKNAKKENMQQHSVSRLRLKSKCPLCPK